MKMEVFSQKLEKFLSEAMKDTPEDAETAFALSIIANTLTALQDGGVAALADVVLEFGEEVDKFDNTNMGADKLARLIEPILTKLEQSSDPEVMSARAVLLVLTAALHAGHMHKLADLVRPFAQKMRTQLEQIIASPDN